MRDSDMNSGFLGFKKQVWLLAIVLTVGMLLSYVVARQVLVSAETQTRERFEVDTNLFVGHLRRNLHSGMTAAQNLQAYYHLSGAFDESTFLLLIDTNRNLSRNRTLVATTLALSEGEARALAQDVTKKYEGLYQLHNPASAASAPSENRVFPLLFRWSNDLNQTTTLLGLNVGAEASLNSFLEQVMADMQASVILLPSFPELDKGQTGQVLMVSPYISLENEPAAIIQVIDINGVMDVIPKNLQQQESLFQVVITTEWSGGAALQSFGVPEGLRASEKQPAVKMGAERRQTIQFGAVTWSVVMTALPGAYAVEYGPAAVTASVGALLTGLLFFIVWSQMQRSQRVAGIVNRRTRALKEAHEELEEHYQLLKNLNKDVEEARLAAERANEAKSEFLATMSHELRTPLNAILGFSQLIQEQTVGAIGDERYVDYAGDIHSSGTHLLALINDILDLAKLEAGKVVIDKKSLVTSDLADRVVTLLSQQASNKDIELKTDFGTNMPEKIIGDELRLRQIMINLCSNAIKFTLKGSVSVRFFAKPFQNGLPGWVLEVQDTGIGIPEENQPTLFDRFTQVDTALSRRHGGVGLGLAICRELVDRMEGRITVRSMVDVGTTIRVHLPLIEVEDGLVDDQSLI